MRKSTFITLFSILGVILVGCVVAKSFLGEQLAIQITNSNIIAIGDWLDAHIWVRRGVSFIITYITYMLYLSAVTKRWFLNWKEILIITPILVALQFAKIYLPTVGMYLDLIAMILIPYLIKADYKMVAIIYTVHCLAQLLSLYARGLPLLMLGTNYAVQIVFMVDQFIIQIMYYIFGNFMKKGDKNYGRNKSTILDKTGVIHGEGNCENREEDSKDRSNS